MASARSSRRRRPCPAAGLKTNSMPSLSQEPMTMFSQFLVEFVTLKNSQLNSCLPDLRFHQGFTVQLEKSGYRLAGDGAWDSGRRAAPGTAKSEGAGMQGADSKRRYRGVFLSDTHLGM